MTDDDLLAEMLLRWEELRAQEQDPSADELCRDHPHLLPELTRRLTALREMAWVDQAAVADGGDEPVDTSAGSTSGAAPSAPRCLGSRYRLDKLIAEGGSGQVWQGYDEDLQRVVAIKVPKRAEMSPSRPVVDFLAEGRKVARLEHPGIVPVYDVGREEGRYFIVSKFVDGESLERLLQRQRPSQAEAVRLVAEVARSLAYAHEQGVIHRDIKPGNVLLDSQVRPHLADFGIAVTGPEVSSAGRAGTLAYMSPEQVSDDTASLDARTDIYSLGVVLYELLASRLPFSDDNPIALREKIVSEPPVSLRTWDRTIPKALNEIVLKCLAKPPVGRYASAGELADALAAFMRSHRRPALERSRLLLAVALVCVTAATAVAFLYLYRSRPTDDSAAPSSPEPAVKIGGTVEGSTCLPGHKGRVAAVAFRPGGTWVASGGADQTVRLWDLSKVNPASGHLILQQTSPVTALCFKRDGTVLAAGCNNGTVRLWNLTGLEPKETAVYAGHAGPVTSLAFTPDGTVLLTGGMDGTVRVLDFSGTPTKTAALPKERGTILALVVSEGGTRLVVAAGDAKKQPAEVHFWELDLKGPKRHIHDRGRGVLKEVVNVRAMAVSPDGTTLLATTATRVAGWSRGQQKDALDLIGVFEKHTGPVNCVSISPDGKSALSGGDDKLIYLWDVKTLATIRSFAGSAGSVASVSFSEDGRRAVSGDESGEVRLWAVVE